MKILFVDESPTLQEKWIEPLRGEGWGVVRARSTEDAEKIFEFHGDSLTALVVSETYVEWAEKWNYAYVVLIKNWKETQVVKHQNASEHPATAYLDYDSKLELVKQAILESKNKNVMRATGTSTSATSRPAMNPDLAPMESSSAPSSASSNDSGVVISFEKYADQKVEIESTSHKASTPLAEAKSNEIQIDLGGSDPEATRQITQAEIAAAAAPASDSDRTVMFDSTAVNLDISPKVEAFIQETPDFTAKIEETNIEDIGQSEESFAMGEEEVIEDDLSIDDSPEIPYANSIQTGGNKDLETMKNYLALREQDVALLTGQMRSTQERVQQLETQLKMERARSSELQHVVQKQEQQIKNFDRDKQVEFEVLFQQVEDLNLQLRERTDKVRTIEAKLKITTDEVEKVKERVRVDIRRIRVREKELESQLEILKKDSTALLVARDEKILELKRKIDLLEFNMELVQEQYGKERNQTEQLRHKLKEAAGVMKRAGGLLDHEN